jgi:hypothetical protein
LRWCVWGAYHCLIFTGVFFQSKVWIAVVTSKAPRGGGKLNGFHNLTASLRSAEGASLRSAGARFARLGLASLAWGSLRLPGVLICHASYRYYR